MKNLVAAFAILTLISTSLFSLPAAAGEQAPAGNRAVVDFPLPGNWQRKQAGELMMYIRPADADIAPPISLDTG